MPALPMAALLLVLLACRTTAAGPTPKALAPTGAVPQEATAPARAPATAGGASALALFHTTRAQLALEAGDGEAAEAALSEALLFDHTSALLHAWRAQAALLRRQPGQALGHADRALQLDPQLPEALEARVDALWAMERQKDAAASLAAWVRLQPGNVSAASRHIQVLLATGQLAAAHQAQAALSLARPNDRGVHRLLTELCLRQSAWGCVIQAAADADRYAPQDVPLCLMAAQARAALTEDATAAFDRCVALAPQEPQVLLAAWRAHVRSGTSTPALASARGVAAVLAQDVDALEPLVEGALDLPSVPLALALLERAPPDHPLVRAGRAAAHALQGQCDQALAALGPPAVDTAPMALLRVRCLVRLGRTRDAAAQWDRHAAQLLALAQGVETGCRVLVDAGRTADALALWAPGVPLLDAGPDPAARHAPSHAPPSSEPPSPPPAADPATNPATDPATDLARARCAVAAGRLPLALEALGARLRQDPDDRTALLALSVVHADAGNLPESVRALRALAALDAADPEVQNALAYTLLQAGHTGAEPLRLARAALAARPDAAEILDTLGVAQQAAGEGAAALASLQKAVQWLPYDSELRLHLGDARAANGDAAGARREWEAGVALLPWDRKVAQDLRQRLGQP
jgi:tetratricopeptide (TPR) repeat protein